MDREKRQPRLLEQEGGAAERMRSRCGTMIAKNMTSKAKQSEGVWACGVFVFFLCLYLYLQDRDLVYYTSVASLQHGRAWHQSFVCDPLLLSGAKLRGALR